MGLSRSGERPGGRPTLDRSLHVELSSTPDDVARARRAVARFAGQAGLDHLETGAVELAVGEACANVARHAYGEAHGAMTIDATADDARLVISVLDRGTGIDTAARRPPNLGLSIMMALTDALEVAPGPDVVGTRVTMTFSI